MRSSRRRTDLLSPSPVFSRLPFQGKESAPFIYQKIFNILAPKDSNQSVTFKLEQWKNAPAGNPNKHNHYLTIQRAPNGNGYYVYISDNEYVLEDMGRMRISIQLHLLENGLVKILQDNSYIPVVFRDQYLLERSKSNFLTGGMNCNNFIPYFIGENLLDLHLAKMFIKDKRTNLVLSRGENLAVETTDEIISLLTLPTNSLTQLNEQSNRLNEWLNICF